MAFVNESRYKFWLTICCLATVTLFVITRELNTGFSYTHTHIVFESLYTQLTVLFQFFPSFQRSLLHLSSACVSLGHDWLAIKHTADKNTCPVCALHKTPVHPPPALTSITGTRFGPCSRSFGSTTNVTSICRTITSGWVAAAKEDRTGHWLFMRIQMWIWSRRLRPQLRLPMHLVMLRRIRTRSTYTRTWAIRREARKEVQRKALIINWSLLKKNLICPP